MKCRKRKLEPWNKETLAAKIQANSAQVGDCVVWLADTNTPGYPRLTELQAGRMRQMTVHRVLWALHKGEIPDGMFVRQSCKNRLCVKLEHLYLQPRSGFAASVRTAVCRANIPGKRAKLTHEQAEYIRNSGLPVVFLAETLGVTPLAVSHVRTGHTWTGRGGGTIRPEVVEAVRTDVGSYYQLASKYGISAGSVQRIKEGKRVAA